MYWSRHEIYKKLHKQLRLYIIRRFRDRVRKTSYNLKTKPVRENKIEWLDVNSDLTIFFVQNIDDEIEIAAEKMKEIKNHEIKSEKSSTAIIKTTDCSKRFKEWDIFLQIMFLQLIQKEYFMSKENVKHQWKGK